MVESRMSSENRVPPPLRNSRYVQRPPDCTTQSLDRSLIGRYVYCSSPKPVPTVRPGYRNNREKPRGAHDYYNMMWDPHVYRGDNFKSLAQAEEERCLLMVKAEEARRRRRAKGRKLGVIARPFTPTTHEKRKNITCQTVQFMEEFLEGSDICQVQTQTDTTDDTVLPLMPRAFVSGKIGQDCETQIHPWELFSFDEEAAPIVDTLVCKVMEQALLETMEEQELSALKELENSLEETRRTELMRLQRLRARQQDILLQNEAIVAENLNQTEKFELVEQLVGMVACAKSYSYAMIPRMIDSFRRDGHFALTLVDECVTNHFIPWLEVQVNERAEFMVQSRTLVDDIVKHVVLAREANIVKDVAAPSATNLSPSIMKFFGIS